MRNYYKDLGVSPTAESQDIAAAYKVLAKKLHPDIASDKNESSARFLEVTEAYETLSDPLKRAAYDKTRNEIKKSRRQRVAIGITAGLVMATSMIAMTIALVIPPGLEREIALQEQTAATQTASNNASPALNEPDPAGASEPLPPANDEPTAAIEEPADRPAEQAANETADQPIETAATQSADAPEIALNEPPRRVEPPANAPAPTKQPPETLAEMAPAPEPAEPTSPQPVEASVDAKSDTLPEKVTAPVPDVAKAPPRDQESKPATSETQKATAQIDAPEPRPAEQPRTPTADPAADTEPTPQRPVAKAAESEGPSPAPPDSANPAREPTKTARLEALPAKIPQQAPEENQAPALTEAKQTDPDIPPLPPHKPNDIPQTAAPSQSERETPKPRIAARSFDENELTREQAMRFVEHHYLSGENRDRTDTTQLYCPRVDYWGEPGLPRSEVHQQTGRFAQRWPHRRYKLRPATFRIRPGPHEESYKVRFIYDFEIFAGDGPAQGGSTGIAKAWLILTHQAKRWKICKEDGRILKQRIHHKTAAQQQSKGPVLARSAAETRRNAELRDALSGD